MSRAALGGAGRGRARPVSRIVVAAAPRHVRARADHRHRAVRVLRRRDGARAGSVPRLSARVPTRRAAGVRAAVARPRGRPQRVRPLVRPPDGALRLRRDRRRGARAARARRGHGAHGSCARLHRDLAAAHRLGGAVSLRPLAGVRSSCSRSPRFCTSGSRSRRSRSGRRSRRSSGRSSSSRSSSCTSGARAVRASRRRGPAGSCSSTPRSSFRSRSSRPPACSASFHAQIARPLQLESLGGALLVALHHIAGTSLRVVTSYGSQNLVGTGTHAAEIVTAIAGVAALVTIWVLYARGPADGERLVAHAAAAVAATLAFGKVFSPQFVIWLVPLVPLVRGRRGIAASALLAVALVLTQLVVPASLLAARAALRAARVLAPARARPRHRRARGGPRVAAPRARAARGKPRHARSAPARTGSGRVTARGLGSARRGHVRRPATA